MTIVDLVAMVAGCAVGLRMIQGRFGRDAVARFDQSGALFSYSSFYLTFYPIVSLLAITLTFAIFVRMIMWKRGILSAEWTAVLLALKLMSWYEINQVYSTIWELDRLTETQTLRLSGWTFLAGCGVIALLILVALHVERTRLSPPTRSLWLVLATAAMLTGPVYLVSKLTLWLPDPEDTRWPWTTWMMWSAIEAWGDLPMLMILAVPYCACVRILRKDRILNIEKPRWPWTCWFSLSISSFWIASWVTDRYTNVTPLAWADIMVRAMIVVGAFGLGWRVTRSGDGPERPAAVG